jgi:chromosome partitioning protein
MTIFSICNIKGGSGKSTTAIHLVGFLSNNGFKTALVDCDGQQSLSAWATSVPSLQDLTIYKSTDVDEIEDNIVELESTHDAVVVDTAGSSEETMKIVISLSDQVVIPLSSSALDITSTVATIKQVVRARRRSAKDITTTVFLNRVVKGTTLLKEARQELEEYKDVIELSPVQIPQAQRIMRLPSDNQTAFDSKANKDLADLYNKLFNQLI